MAVLKFNIILLFLTIGYIDQGISQCSDPFSDGDSGDLCYYYKKSFLSWTDAYNQCLTNTIGGLLIQISSVAQFNALKNANIDGKGSFWLGANNFASFLDSQWHWLDGSTVDKSVITWCPDSTYQKAIGTYCAVYNSTSQCVTNYMCNTLLPAPCVAITNEITQQVKSILTPRSSSTGTCTSSYGTAYANWWTYSLLLLNWFILFCFILHLHNRFNMNKRMIIITVIIFIISFLTILAFAVLWGLQYQNLTLIPLILAILGCFASIFFLINILIMVSDRHRVQRWIACMIATIITTIVECILMLGLLLCIAYCSSYISLPSTIIDKDAIAGLLSAIITAMSIVFINGILCLIDDQGQDRIHAVGTNPVASVPLTTIQAAGSRRSEATEAVNTRVTAVKRNDQIERATSPVDERILNEFYSDHPRDMHKYHLEGRQYVVYEGKTFNDVDAFRNDLTQAMLLQEPQGLREAIARTKNSVHATALADEIRQAENLLTKLK